MYNSLLNNTDISMNTAVWRHSPVKTVKHFPGNRAQTSIKTFCTELKVRESIPWLTASKL